MRLSDSYSSGETRLSSSMKLKYYRLASAPLLAVFAQWICVASFIVSQDAVAARKHAPTPIPTVLPPSAPAEQVSKRETRVEQLGRDVQGLDQTIAKSFADGQNQSAAKAIGTAQDHISFTTLVATGVIGFLGLAGGRSVYISRQDIKETKNDAKEALGKLDAAQTRAQSKFDDWETRFDEMANSHEPAEKIKADLKKYINETFERPARLKEETILAIIDLLLQDPAVQGDYRTFLVNERGTLGAITPVPQPIGPKPH